MEEYKLIEWWQSLNSAKQLELLTDNYPEYSENDTTIINTDMLKVIYESQQTLPSYKKWFLSLPQEEKVMLMKKYTHLQSIEDVNELMAKAIWLAKEREEYFNAKYPENIDIEICPCCYERTIIDCDDKTCLNYTPK